MPRIRRAKDLELLAEQLSGYDTVIVPEQSIADALSERIEAEVSTPEAMLSDGSFRQELFFDLSQDHSWKQASYMLRNAESCLKATGGLEALEEAGFSSGDIDRLEEAFEQVENPYTQAEEVSLEGRTAAVDPRRLDEVWKQRLLGEYDEYELLTDDETDLDGFHSFRSGGEMARAVADSVEEAGEESCAIVAPDGSGYRSLAESELEARGINYTRNDRLSASDQIRTFLALARMSSSGGRIRAEDIKPAIGELDVSLSERSLSRNLDSVDSEGAEEIREFLNVMAHLEFGEAVDRLRELGMNTGEVEAAVESLGLAEMDINQLNLERMEYYLKRFEPSETSEEGVLVTKPEEAAVVDREHVFFLGLDTEWNREVEEKPWKDDEQERQKILELFQLALQSGAGQHYMIDESSEEKPCFHLTEVLDSAPTDFSDLPVRKARPEDRTDRAGFQKRETNIEPKRIDTVSQSSLNSFALSPRIYYFDKLVSEAEEARLVKGQLFHDFAEFYVNHPDFADDIDAVEFMKTRLEPFVDRYELEEAEKEFEVGVRNIKKYIRREDFSPVDLEGFETRSDNAFAEEFDRPLRFELTELKFEDPEIGAKGKVDFLKDENHIVDYKSGRKKSVEKAVKKSKVELHEEERFPDFQPAMYLTYLRKQRPGERLKFTFFHFLDSIGEHVKGNGDIDDALVTVEYVPEEFDSFVSFDEFFDQLTSGVAKSNNRRKTLEKLGRESFKRFMRETRVPEVYDKNKMLETDFVADLNGFAKQEVGDYKYVEKGIRSAAKKLVGIRSRKFFREDLDRFEEFLEEKIEEINRCRKKGFPLDAEIEDLPKRDMLIDDGGEDDD